ncbi:Rgp1-domain-containing protein [Linderina pennispora]|uniref:Rgp1-domain-containing protein n=1 Tax=Linderina pennispora TaxID=61395 RepID=A0A1Y1W1J3_9FUNG|nr:Rgp1-domain-containing protein [Linderina pennispora]ORX67096.1 Rgp1-domain-containing protein [Linderina pennispora]
MGLTITATFEKQGIYFAGDTLECHVRFANERSTQTLSAIRAANAPSGPARTQVLAPRQQAALSFATSAGHTDTGGRVQNGLAGGANLDGGPEHSTIPGNSRGPRRSSAWTGRRTTAGAKTGGLSVFPALGEGSVASTEHSPRLGAVSRRASGRNGLGLGLDGWSDRKPSTVRDGDLRLAKSPMLGGGPQNRAAEPSQFPRLSTSSVLSNPSGSLASWFSLGNRAAAQESARRVPNDGTASDSGGLLGSLWRNISGSNPPSRPATRAGSVAADEGMERLAIGFAEASGSLMLSPSYIKPEQMDLLLQNSGTATDANGAASPTLMGGGMGSSTPTTPSAGKAIPLLISSPTVLFSELALGTGESQTFSLKIQLPTTLPPSFRGRSARVSYELVVVAKRSMLESSAYVVRIPFRVQAFVDANGKLREYGLARPVRLAPDQSRVAFQESQPGATPRNHSPSLVTDTAEPSACAASEAVVPTSDALSSDALCAQLAQSAFLKAMLQHVELDAASRSSDGTVPAIDISGPPASSDSGELSKQHIRDECRRRAPVAFSLSQGGRAVASVWLPKRSYQLGDMVSGRIEVHVANVHVYQVSIWLESVEHIGERFSLHSDQRTEELTRRVHGEHHEFCRSTQTTGFALTTLPAAQASFQSAIVSNAWQLRIELIIGMPGASICDLRLSNSTVFPPAKHLGSRASASRTLPMSPASPHPQTVGRPNGLKADRRYTVSISPIALATPLTAPARPSDTASERPPRPPHTAGEVETTGHPMARTGSSGRTRSSTFSDNTAHALPSPLLVSRNGASRPPTSNGVVPGSPALRSAPLPLTDQVPKTPGKLSPIIEASSLPQTAPLPTHAPKRSMRRRFDIVPAVHTQTLSCTVAVQMHPALARPPGTGRSFTIDLSQRGLQTGR